MLGHSTFKELAQGRNDALHQALMTVVGFIYTFHMPLFFFISGMLFAHTTHEAGPLPSAKFLSDKAKRLLVPYVAISSCAFPIKALLAKDALHPVELTLAEYLRTLFYPWNNTIIFFWFLVTLFLMFLLAPLLRQLTRRMGFAGSAVLVGILVWVFLSTSHGSPQNSTLLNWQGAAHNLIYFYVGMIALKPAIKLGECVARSAMFVLSAVLLGIVLLTYRYLEISIPGVQLMLGLLGTFAVVTLAMVSQNRWPSLWLPLESYSFQIYLLSWFPLQFIKLLAKRIPEMTLGGWSILSLLAQLLLPILVAKFVQRIRHPVTSTILGM